MVANSNKLESGWLSQESKISIVVPCYNEEECLTALAREMKLALDPLDYDWEVLLINDCSTDSTWRMMKVINHWDSRFKAIHLAYNSGQTAGTLAGIRSSKGDAVITMDADLQPQDTLGEVRIDYRDRIGGKTKYGATRILKGVRDLIYITMITRLKGNILANLYANFMVYLHYDQGRDTYRIASKIGFD